MAEFEKQINFSILFENITRISENYKTQLTCKLISQMEKQKLHVLNYSEASNVNLTICGWYVHCLYIKTYVIFSKTNFKCF